MEKTCPDAIAGAQSIMSGMPSLNIGDIQGPGVDTVNQGLEAIANTGIMLNHDFSPNITTGGAGTLSGSRVEGSFSYGSLDTIACPERPDIEGLGKYLSDLLTALQSWITGVMTNGFFGLQPEVQDAMFNLQVEREMQGLLEAKDKVNAQWATGNWAMPDDVLAAGTGMIEKDYLASLYTRSTEIRKQSLKISQEMMFLAIEEGVKLERALLLYDVALRKIVASIYKAEVDIYVAQVKATLASFEILIKHAGAYAAQAEGTATLKSIEAGIVSAGNSLYARIANDAADLVSKSASVASEQISKSMMITQKAIDAVTQGANVIAAAQFSQFHSQQSFSSGESFEEQSSFTQNVSVGTSCTKQITGEA